MHKPQADSDLKMEDLTREELKKIEKSMKRPQFMGLLSEYMVEISDPKNKEEYDQYLKQMQKEGELPKHMKLVKLQPEFCFRTHIISTKNKKHQMKFFINMCSTEYMEKPSCQPGPSDKGEKGFSWQVPNSMGKIRYDQDKHKNPCQVVDCAFHPDSFKFAASYPAFQAMIIGIALEAAERQLGERKQTLSKDYVILKNLKCKGQKGEPALLPIRYIEGKVYNRGEGPVEQERDLEGKQTKLQKQINEQKEKYEQEKKDGKVKQKQDDENIMEEDLEDEKKPLIEDLQKGIQVPKYSSIYTYMTDYTEFIDDPNPGYKKKPRKLPSKITLQFKVPRMEKMSEVTKLQINQTKIIFEVEEKYFLDLSFEDLKNKYPLKTNEAKAKYDKKKKALKVEVPIDQTNIEMPIESEEFNEENRIQQVNQIEEQAKVIEDEIWKNKILEVPEQSVGVRFLQQKPVTEEKPEKKLIEEIDEDDFLEEEESIAQKEEKDPRLQKFTLRSYHTEKKTQTVISQPTQLNPIFKETPSHVVVMFHLINYKEEQISFIPANDEMMLEWNRKGEKYLAHLSIDQEKKQSILGMQSIQRVSFLGWVIKKKRNLQWGNECLINEIDSYGLGKDETIYDKFKANLNQIKKKQIEHLKKKEQQEQQLKEIESEQKNQTTSEISRNKSIQEPVPSKMEEIDEQIEPLTSKFQEKTQEKFEAPLFEKLPPQFIRFSAKFIDVLN